MFATGTLFWSSIMFMCKARSLTKSFRCFTCVGSDLTHKQWTRLERPGRDKHSCILPTFINYGREKFYNIEPRCRGVSALLNCSSLLQRNVNYKWKGFIELLPKSLKTLANFRIFRRIDFWLNKQEKLIERKGLVRMNSSLG